MIDLSGCLKSSSSNLEFISGWNCSTSALGTDLSSKLGDIGWILPWRGTTWCYLWPYISHWILYITSYSKVHHLTFTVHTIFILIYDFFLLCENNTLRLLSTWNSMKSKWNSTKQKSMEAKALLSLLLSIHPFLLYLSHCYNLGPETLRMLVLIPIAATSCKIQGVCSADGYP